MGLIDDDIQCPVCKSYDIDWSYEGGDVPIYKCNSCGHLF